MYAKGENVTIYYDPITETKPEGIAVLIEHQKDSGTYDGRMLQIWMVKFLSDGFITVRGILTK